MNSNAAGLIYKYIHKSFPQVNCELSKWLRKSSQIEDPILRKLATASISDKKFHCLGGSIYSLYKGTDTNTAIRFIVAFQTISDYLDNLCDRAEVYDESAFRQLHISLLDAVDLKSGIHDYYSLFPYHKDSGYLTSLVETCKHCVCKLNAYESIIVPFKKYINLYIDLQSLKHIDIEKREKALNMWASFHTQHYPDISNWEFSAAAGSTLIIFLLFAAAFDPLLSEKEVSSITEAYFPWICGLHILLDYYIDSSEDYEAKDLNFTHYYKNLFECQDRLSFFINNSFEKCALLKHPNFHLTVVNGLLALYLSDQKAGENNISFTSKKLLKVAGKRAITYYYICKFLRQLKKL